MSFLYSPRAVHWHLPDVFFLGKGTTTECYSSLVLYKYLEPWFLFECKFISHKSCTGWESWAWMIVQCLEPLWNTGISQESCRNFARKTQETRKKSPPYSKGGLNVFFKCISVVFMHMHGWAFVWSCCHHWEQLCLFTIIHAGKLMQRMFDL